MVAKCIILAEIVHFVFILYWLCHLTVIVHVLEVKLSLHENDREPPPPGKIDSTTCCAGIVRAVLISECV